MRSVVTKSERGQEHISIIGRAERGFIFLWVQLLVFSTRQEVIPFSVNRHENDEFSINNVRKR